MKRWLIATLPIAFASILAFQNCSGTPGASTAKSSLTVSAVGCTFNGTSLTDGQTTTAYATATATAGGSCQSQTLTCSKGAMTGGTYTYSSCNGAAANCTFNGTTVISGQSYVGYATPNVSSGQTCMSKTFTCTNGTLAASDSSSISSYPFASCLACSSGGTAVTVSGTPANACFYLASGTTSAVSCDQTCASRGGYNALTETLIGYNGTTAQNANCQAVVQQIPGTNFSGSNPNGSSTCSNVGLGCVGTSEAYALGNGQNIPVWDVCTGAVTSSSAASAYWTRVCACNK